MNKRKQRGFTIIEVVLVLAIAGLIFLMVFIALPTLQSNRKDTQRRSDVSRLRAQINQFQANQKGAVPTVAQMQDVTTAGFVNQYLKNGGSWQDPKTGIDYPTPITYNTNFATTLGTGAVDAGKWTYLNNAKCTAGADTFTTGTGVRTYAVAMKLEGAGFACQDNQ